MIKDVDQALWKIEGSTAIDNIDDTFKLYQLYSHYHLASIADITIQEFNSEYSWNFKDLDLYVYIENYKNNNLILGESEKNYYLLQITGMAKLTYFMGLDIKFDLEPRVVIFFKNFILERF